MKEYLKECHLHKNYFPNQSFIIFTLAEGFGHKISTCNLKYTF